MASSIEERFWPKVNKTDTCWLWTAASNGSGYGVFRMGNKIVYAHRVSYEISVGPIPLGMEIDHVKTRGCLSTLCVNPLHLEPVVPKENVRRSSSFAGINATKTKCPKGHGFKGLNLRTNSKGARLCRTCDNEKNLLYYHNKKKENASEQ